MDKTATRRPKFEPHILESICRTIADTNVGLTGSEIGQTLRNCDMVDVDALNTKWKRLYNAFVEWQNKNQCSNHILKFIQVAMQPARYIGQEALFHDRRVDLNKRLSFVGLELAETGKYRIVSKSTTISEAEERANRFKHKLESRNVHSFIFNYCKAELLVENYFHSVFEATKSLADRIRKITGLQNDGNALVETAFSTTIPLIKINDLKNDSERSEHIGLCNLVKGIFGLIRNPTAHEPKIKFIITEDEALYVMVTISYIHKRLDKIIL